MTDRTCCICGCTIVRNYYRIDGLRYWCPECGYQWLREHSPTGVYVDRVREAMRKKG